MERARQRADEIRDDSRRARRSATAHRREAAAARERVTEAREQAGAHGIGGDTSGRG